jgi:Immunity protein 26
VASVRVGPADADTAASFELTDDERAVVGLLPRDASWQSEWIGAVKAYFDGDVLRKYVYAHKEGYLEVDTELLTMGRKQVRPRKATGKPRTLTPALLGVTERSKGRWFQVTFSDAGLVTPLTLNCRTMRSLSLPPAPIADASALRHYLAENGPDWKDQYRDDIVGVLFAPRQKIAYRPGDVFRFRLGPDSYGFGLLVAELRTIRQWKVLEQEHPLNRVMMVPLVVRLYAYTSPQAQPHLADLTAQPLLPGTLMTDHEIYYGNLPVIGQLELTPAHVDFPLGYGVSSGHDHRRYFYWGFGVHHDVPDLTARAPGAAAGTLRLADGRGIGSLDTGPVRAALASGLDHGVERSDLRHPELAELRTAVLHAIGYRGPLDYAAYSTWAGCLTPEQYVQRLHAGKSGRAGGR